MQALEDRLAFSGVPPVAHADMYRMKEDETLTVAAELGLLTNDTFAVGTAPNAVLVAGPAHGSLALNPNGSFTYKPELNYNGSDTFTYKANDGAADSEISAVTLSV